MYCMIVILVAIGFSLLIRTTLVSIDSSLATLVIPNFFQHSTTSHMFSYLPHPHQKGKSTKVLDYCGIVTTIFAHLKPCILGLYYCSRAPVLTVMCYASNFSCNKLEFMTTIQTHNRQNENSCGWTDIYTYKFLEVRIVAHLLHDYLLITNAL